MRQDPGTDARAVAGRGAGKARRDTAGRSVDGALQHTAWQQHVRRPLPTEVSLNISSRLSPVMKIRRMPSGFADAQVSVVDEPFECTQADAQGLRGFLPRIHDGRLDGDLVAHGRSAFRVRFPVTGRNPADDPLQAGVYPIVSACQGDAAGSAQRERAHRGCKRPARGGTIHSQRRRLYWGVEATTETVRGAGVIREPGSWTASPGRRAATEFPPRAEG